MGTILKYKGFIAESKKEEYIERYCKTGDEIPTENRTITSLVDDLKKLNSSIGYKNTLASIEKGEAAIISVRNKLEIRKKHPEQYVDHLYFIPKNAVKDNITIDSFPVTTVPSVAWFDSDVAILNDGEYKYKIGTHTFNSLNKTIPALVPDSELGPKKINVLRFSEKDDDIETFDPPKKDIGTGTNFHYGLEPRCVGGYSAGCQVIPTVEKWNQFWDLVKKSGQKSFWYSIIEKDKI